MPASMTRAAALLLLSLLAASARGASGAVTWPGTVGSGAPGFQGGYYYSNSQQSGSAWTYANCTAQCTNTANCVAVIVQSSMSTAAATGNCYTVTTSQLGSSPTVVADSGFTTYIGPTTTTACTSSPCTALAQARTRAAAQLPRGAPPSRSSPLRRRPRRTLALPTAC